MLLSPVAGADAAVSVTDCVCEEVVSVAILVYSVVVV